MTTHPRMQPVDDLTNFCEDTVYWKWSKSLWYLAAFWLIRLIAAIWVLDVTPYLTNGWWRLGYHATNVVFGLLPFFYAWLAFR